MDQKSWMPCTSKIWPPTCNNFSFNLLLVSKSIAFYYFLNQNMHVLFILKVTVNFLRLIELYRMSWWPIEITIWLFSTHSIFIWYFSSILLMAAPSFHFSNQFSFFFPFLYNRQLTPCYMLLCLTRTSQFVMKLQCYTWVIQKAKWLRL